jgi:hypothetical protein
VDAHHTAQAWYVHTIDVCWANHLSYTYANDACCLLLAAFPLSSRLMDTTPVVIGVASYLLPQESFPWQRVRAIVHYDMIDHSLMNNPATVDEYQSSMLVEAMIKDGSIASWR